jgi:hypothetical protein
MSRNALWAVTLIAALLIAANCKKVPTTPIKPIGNANPFQGVTETYKTMSTDPKGKQIEYVFDWGDATKFDTTQFARSGETTGPTKTWTKDGSVKALAITDDGRKSNGWSDPLAVTLGANTKPGKPDQIISDRDAATPKDDITLWTRAVDPENDRVQIKFFYDIDSNPSKCSDWLPKGDTGVPSGQLVYDSYRYSRKREVPYRLVALARDIKNGSPALLSDTSSSKFITVGNVALGWRYPALDPSPQEPIGGVFFTPLIVQGVNEVYIYASSDFDSVYKLTDKGHASVTEADAGFHNEDQPSGLEAASMSSDGLRIYVPTDDGKLYIMTAASLNLVNSFAPDTFRTEFTTPAVFSNLLYAGRGDSLICMRDDGTGLAVVWQYNSGSEILYPPVINSAGDRIFFGNDSAGEFICLDNLGTFSWQSFQGGPVTGPAAIGANNVIYVAREDGAVYGYNQSDSTVVYSTATSIDNVIGCPVINEAGMIFVAREGGTVDAYPGLGLNVPPTWHYVVGQRPNPNAGIAGAPCLAPDTTILVAAQEANDENVYALKQYPGPDTVVWSVTLPVQGPPKRRFIEPTYSTPVVGPSFSRVYVASAEDGYIYGITVGKDSYVAGLPPLAPWPKWQHDYHNSGHQGGPWVY